MVIDHPAIIFSLALILNTLIVIIAQPLLSTAIEKMSTGLAMLLGFLCVIPSMLSLVFLDTFGIFLSTVMISLAEVILFLKIELMIVYSSTAMLATTLGTQRLFMGAGAFFSAMIGGKLFESYANDQKHLFWLDISYQALMVFAIIITSHCYPSIKQDLKKAVKVSAG